MKHSFYLLVIGTFFSLLGCKKDDTVAPAEVASHTYSVPSWNYSSPEYYVDLNVAEITSSNLNSSSVMVYFSTDNGTSWFAIPYVQYHSPFNYFMGFVTQVGKVQIYWIYDTSTSAGNDPNAFYGVTVQYKVVVVSKTARQANPDVDLKDYKAVKERFKLAE